MCYSFRIAARDLLYVQSQRQDSTHHGRRYTGWETLPGTKKQQQEGSIR